MFSKILHSNLTLALVLFVFSSLVGEKSKFALLEYLGLFIPSAIRGKISRAITDC